MQQYLFPQWNVFLPLESRSPLRWKVRTAENFKHTTTRKSFSLRNHFHFPPNMLLKAIPINFFRTEAWVSKQKINACQAKKNTNDYIDKMQSWVILRKCSSYNRTRKKIQNTSKTHWNGRKSSSFLPMCYSPLNHQKLRHPWLQMTKHQKWAHGGHKSRRKELGQRQGWKNDLGQGHIFCFYSLSPADACELCPSFHSSFLH